MFFDLVRATLKDKSEMCIHVAEEKINTTNQKNE